MSDKSDRNEDPITGEPGAHPIGTGVGAAGGAATGATIGAVGGPVGSVVGAVIGGIAGGLAGKAVAEGVDPTVEDAYWRENHTKQAWATDDDDFDSDYAPAYRAGYAGYAKRGNRFEDAEAELENGWEQTKAKSSLKWHEAKNAVRAGWNRVERGIPGDADGDGR